jgi:hypothetical protein
MPTSPHSPLKSRTAGFPQYGFKADISDDAFPSNHEFVASRGLQSSFVYFATCNAESSFWVEGRGALVVHHRSSGPLPLYPRGPRSGPGYVVPVHHHLVGLMRPTCQHSAISPHSGVYALPSLCPI